MSKVAKFLGYGFLGFSLVGLGYFFGADSYHFNKLQEEVEELRAQKIQDDKEFRQAAELVDGLRKTTTTQNIQLASLKDEGRKIFNMLKEISYNQRSLEACKWWDVMGRYDSTKKRYVFDFNGERITMDREE